MPATRQIPAPVYLVPAGNGAAEMNNPTTAKTGSPLLMEENDTWTESPVPLWGKPARLQRPTAFTCPGRLIEAHTRLRVGNYFDAA